MADFECTNRAMALSVLETTANSLEGIKKTALLAVREWVFQNTFKMPKTVEERQARIKELMRERRNRMASRERREEAAFFLEGLEGGLE
jgi:hypothetical protein